MGSMLPFSYNSQQLNHRASEYYPSPPPPSHPPQRRVSGLSLIDSQMYIAHVHLRAPPPAGCTRGG